MSTPVQDWTPMVLRKNTQPPAKVVSVTSIPSNRVTSSVNMRKLDSDENYTIPKMTRELGQQISQGRVKIKLTQDQLAHKCAIPVAVLREYEKGQGVYNRRYLDPLCKELGITLARPHPKSKVVPADAL